MNAPVKLNFDPITLEVFRNRLAAVAEEGATTVERTACSPVIAESHDNACTLLEANGNLIIGGGAVAHNYGACDHAVKSTLTKHAGTIVSGDVFIANDPHNGGGLHAQDVIVQQPIFIGDRLVAWVANSGHMMDMGGMAFGSWAPAATDCYQEALRFPPIRLFRAGVEQEEVWAILRTNIRASGLVEMDLRSLVAGCQVAHDKIVGIVSEMGPDRFIAAVDALQALTEREMRRRISLLEDGVYTVKTWTEWNDEIFPVPCALTIDGDRMLFDFEGAAPQSTHFFNSKPHIIAAILVSDITDTLAYDLPLSAGMFVPIEIRCPPGTVVNSEPPAPVASAHFDIALNASMAAQQCVMMAIAATGHNAPGRHLLSGPLSPSSMGLHTWSYTTPYGTPDGWLMIDGAMVGGSAGHDRDGYDLFSFMVARKAIVESIDIEMLEQRFPVLVTRKQPRSGAAGAGKYRSGAGCQMLYKPHGASSLSGVMLGMRERVPLSGLAGGFPGANTSFHIHRDGKETEIVSGHENNLMVFPDDVFELRLGSGGGYGDPIDRDPPSVARDIRLDRITADEAAAIYGVILLPGGAVDESGTQERRASLLRERLSAASPPACSIDAAVPTEPGQPLYVGIQQHGNLAVATASGAILARAPAHWTDGCPVLNIALGRQAEAFAYLDPLTGRTLLVDVVPKGESRATTSLPKRWTHAGENYNKLPQ